MRSSLLIWLLACAASPAFPQAITSGVYAGQPLPLVNQPALAERTLLEGSTRDFSHLTLQAITLPANQPAQFSQQLDEEALLIIKAGEVTLTLAGKREILGPGSLAVIMPGDDYRVENKAARPLSYYLMRYTSNQMPDLDLYRLAGGSFWLDWQEVSAMADPQGGTRRMVAQATVMSNHVEMELVSLNAGSESQALHSHRAAELLISLDHPLEAHIAGALTGAQAGDVIFVESEIPHRIRNRSNEAHTYLAIRF